MENFQQQLKGSERDLRLLLRLRLGLLQLQLRLRLLGLSEGTERRSGGGRSAERECRLGLSGAETECGLRSWIRRSKKPGPGRSGWLAKERRSRRRRLGRGEGERSCRS